MWQKDKINMSPLSSFSWGSVWLIPILAVFHASVCGDDSSFVLFLLGGISVVYTELQSSPPHSCASWMSLMCGSPTGVEAAPAGKVRRTQLPSFHQAQKDVLAKAMRCTRQGLKSEPQTPPQFATAYSQERESMCVCAHKGGVWGKYLYGFICFPMLIDKAPYEAVLTNPISSGRC